MDKNKFIITPSTKEVNPFLIASGYATIDTNYSRTYQKILSSSDNYDQTFNKPILKSEMVYLTNFPSKVISYEEMVAYGKNKYFWDALGQKLYKFIVINYPEFNYIGDVESVSDLPTENNEIGDVYLTTNYNIKYCWVGEKWEKVVTPFIKQHQVVVGVEGSPLENILVNIEFSKADGTFNEVILDMPTNNCIKVKGHPSQHAKRPYIEGTYYLDTVNNKYYLFTSNYTANKDKWYYDSTLTNSVLYKYSPSSNALIAVNSTMVLEGNPNELISIITDETDNNSLKINIDDINKLIGYCDKTTDTLYYFDYGQFFVSILYSNVIYERFFDFYRKLQDVYLDVNSSTKIKNKDIYYVGGHPRKVKDPQEDRYYYDTKKQRYYEYNDSDKSWTVVPQENILIPHTYFPHTNGSILRKVTLAYYDIIDCYTKKEVNRMMPVIPGYISFFNNDVGYIYEHQDITVKQDKLTEGQLIPLKSGVTISKVNSWDNVVQIANEKQDSLTSVQLAALDSGITRDIVQYMDYIGELINGKATKGTTLKNYGITDAYTTNELESALNSLINQLNKRS